MTDTAKATVVNEQALDSTLEPPLLLTASTGGVIVSVVPDRLLVLSGAPKFGRWGNIQVTQGNLSLAVGSFVGFAETLGALVVGLALGPCVGEIVGAAVTGTDGVIGVGGSPPGAVVGAKA